MQTTRRQCPPKLIVAPPALLGGAQGIRQAASEPANNVRVLLQQIPDIVLVGSRQYVDSIELPIVNAVLVAAA
jgi:hypothetical protein